MNPVNIDIELTKLLRNSPAEMPELVLSRIDQTLEHLPARQHSKKPVRTVLWASTAAAMVAGCIVGSAFVSPNFAMALRQVPGLESVFRIVGDLGLKTADERGLVSNINQSVTDQGITLRILETMYDGSRLTVGYVQESPGGIQELDDVEYAINGTPMHFPGSGSGSRIDDHTYAGVLNITPEKELPDKFRLTVTVQRIGTTDGRWQFSFPVRKMASSNKVVIPMTTRTAGDLTLTVNKITFTPSATELNLQIKQPKQVQRFIDYELVDDKGAVFERRGGSGGGRTEGDDEIMDFKQMFGPVQDVPKTVTVRPILNTLTTEPLKETRVALEQAPDESHPLLLSQGPSGSLKITQVEYRKDKTLIHYQTEGVQPFMQSTQLWMEDESGKKHMRLDKPTETVDPIHYKFIREFPAFRPDQKLTVVTRELPVPNYIKELEMTIPIAP